MAADYTLAVQLLHEHGSWHLVWGGRRATKVTPDRAVAVAEMFDRGDEVRTVIREDARRAEENVRERRATLMEMVERGTAEIARLAQEAEQHRQWALAVGPARPGVAIVLGPPREP